MSRLLVLGNAGWDLVCPVANLPRAGETVVTVGHARAPGGKGLNQAVVAARAGACVTLAAPVGRDEAAAALAAALAGERLAFEAYPQNAVTDQSLLMVAPDGENGILSFGACAEALPVALAEAIADRLVPGDWLLLQGNLSQLATEAAMRRARRRGARVMFNPAPLRWDVTAMLALCDVVVANTVEASAITGGVDAAALQAAGAAVAVVTLGGEGCAVADSHGVRRFPAETVVVVDTTGAGDTVCGVLVAALMAGRDVDVAIAAAMRMAAVTVQRSGAFAALPEAVLF